MKIYLENYTNKKNAGCLVKSTNASNVFHIVLAFRFVITEIAFTMIKLIILVLETISLVLSSKLDDKLNIGAVIPSFIQEVEKKAYLMINAYGKTKAEKVAVGYANDLNKEINELKHYDGEKIKRMNDRKWYWLTVASTIKNWV